MGSVPGKQDGKVRGPDPACSRNAAMSSHEALLVRFFLSVLDIGGAVANMRLLLLLLRGSFRRSASLAILSELQTLGGHEQ